MVMIEALATGTPVVATSRGSASEIIREGITGYLRTGLQGLAEALLAAAALHRRACRLSVEEQSSADRMVAAHLRFYEECIGSRP
jgi:glycosyltransferase involved in cell wall biosynthesis